MQNIPGSDRKLFPTIRELLCFAALLGFSEQRRVPLDRAAGVDAGTKLLNEYALFWAAMVLVPKDVTRTPFTYNLTRSSGMIFVISTET